MRENTAASVQEFVWQWERRARMTKPTEAEQAINVWREQQTAGCRRLYRAAIAKALVALATRIAPPKPVTGERNVAAGYAPGSN